MRNETEAPGFTWRPYPKAMRTERRLVYPSERSVRNR
jgi:hypothetical protein